jgi:curved DNA-binding protein CbpA
MKEFIDYYKLLGVRPEATPIEIKQAYHAFARQFHPDYHFGRENEARFSGIFQDISEAYYILSDPALRDEYDRKSCRRSAAFFKGGDFKYPVDFGPVREKGHRRIIWTRYRALNIVLDWIELAVMLMILTLPFVAPFILIFLFLLFFRN